MNDLVEAPTACEAASQGSARDESPSLAFLLLGVAHEVEARLEDSLAPVGLSLAKHRLLTRLMEAGEPVPLGCLADRCSCVRSNMTQLVDRLEAESLVERRNDSKDRRSVLAGITELGRARQIEGAERLAEIEIQIFGGLSEADRRRLEGLLGHLRSAT